MPFVFHFKGHLDDVVKLTGDFNEWRPVEMLKQSDGHILKLLVNATKFRFAFIVPGQQIETSSEYEMEQMRAIDVLEESADSSTLVTVNCLDLSNSQTRFFVRKADLSNSKLTSLTDFMKQEQVQLEEPLYHDQSLEIKSFKDSEE